MNTPYQVFDPSGQEILGTTARCRYPRHIELDMLDAGYVIKLGGKKLTKTEIRKERDRKC